jgi:hypothetical protein
MSLFFRREFAVQQLTIAIEIERADISPGRFRLIGGPAQMRLRLIAWARRFYSLAVISATT